MTVYAKGIYDSKSGFPQAGEGIHGWLALSECAKYLTLSPSEKDKN
jgi:hypothetical protein